MCPLRRRGDEGGPPDGETTGAATGDDPAAAQRQYFRARFTLDEGRPIEAGSPWEVETRAHTIWACEELTRLVNVVRPPELHVIVPQVDARLWVPFHRTHYPHHLTKTIYY